MVTLPERCLVFFFQNRGSLLDETRSKEAVDSLRRSLWRGVGVEEHLQKDALDRSILCQDSLTNQ